MAARVSHRARRRAALGRGASGQVGLVQPLVDPRHEERQQQNDDRHDDQHLHEDNYGRKPIAWLPEVLVRGRQNPVVQVVDEANGETVYTLRINGTRFRPKVFRAGTYILKVGEGGRQKVISGVSGMPGEQKVTLDVDLQ